MVVSPCPLEGKEQEADVGEPRHRPEEPVKPRVDGWRPRLYDDSVFGRDWGTVRVDGYGLAYMEDNGGRLRTVYGLMLVQVR